MPINGPQNLRLLVDRNRHVWRTTVETAVGMNTTAVMLVLMSNGECEGRPAPFNRGEFS